jgi:hypothetical protein
MFSYEKVKLRFDKDEQHGLVRLQMVLAYIQAYSDMFDLDYLEDIISLEDYKGYLTVIWSKQPSLTILKIIEKAWASRIGDCGGDQISHIIRIK